MRGQACDSLQCLLEFDGETWRLKQESLTHPTFVDGDLTPYAPLKSGSKLTFLDGSGFVLRQMKPALQESYLPEIPRWVAFVLALAGLTAVGGLVYFAWHFLSRL